MNGRTLVVIAALAGLAGAAGYYFVLQPLASTPAAVEAQSPTATTTEPAAAPRAQLATVIPEFKLADREGIQRSLRDDWKGKALIVNFWATWCAPCRREIPLLNQLAVDHAGRISRSSASRSISATRCSSTPGKWRSTTRC